MSRYSSAAESELFKQLQAGNPLLAGSVLSCWQVAEKELRHIASVHITFTSHGPDHSLALLRILDNMVLDTNLKLSADEIYILICATLLHDIGMLAQIGADSQANKVIRNDHHIRSFDRIMLNWESYALQKEYVKSIAEVAAAHREIKIEGMQERTVGVSYGAPPRARLCALLLRIADECHITSDRVPDDYSVLGLPEESLKHFAIHAMTIGPNFRASSNAIFYATAEIESQDQSTFLRAACSKIEKQINEYEPLLIKYGVPYRKVVLEEDRDKVIEYKLHRLLLNRSSIGKSEAIIELTKDGERTDDIQRLIDARAKALGILSADGSSLCLSRDVVTAARMAKLFIEGTGTKSDQLIFAQSMYTASITGSQEFIMGLRKSISLTDPFDSAIALCKASPRALEHALSSMNSTPKSRPTGVFSVLLGLFEQDLEQFPELLLTPDLIDNAYREGEINKRGYIQRKALQAVHYLKAFDPNKIFQQWVVSRMNEPDDGTSKGEKRRGSINFNLHKTAVNENPMLMFAASLRMRLPFTVEETDNVRISMEMEGQEPLPKQVDGFSHIIIMPQESAPLDSAVRYCPVNISKDDNGEFVLTFNLDHSGTLEDWKTPLRGRLSLVSYSNIVGENELENARFKFDLSLNYEELDCQSACLILEASRTQTDFVVQIQGQSNSTTVKTGPMDFSLLLLAKEDREIVEKLAKIQKLIGFPITMPQTSFPVEVLQELQKPIETRQDAEDRIQVLKSIIGNHVQHITPLICEVWIENRIVDRLQIWRAPGHHAIRLNVGSRDPSNNMVQDTMENPNKGLQAWQVIRLSPEEAISRLLLDQEPSHEAVVDQISKIIKEEKSESVEEFQTLVALYWHPEDDKILYKSTPFRLAFSQYLPWQRWGMESDDLLKRNDIPRSYFAAKEAYRLRPNDAETIIRYGWVCYKAGFLEKALGITSQLTRTEDKDFQYLARINCALAELMISKKSDSNSRNHLIEALRHYRNAFELITGEISAVELNQKVYLAFNDLFQDFNLLEKTGKWIMDQLNDIRMGLCSTGDLINRIDQKISELEIDETE